jgi:hypothetical protein
MPIALDSSRSAFSDPPPPPLRLQPVKPGRRGTALDVLALIAVAVLIALVIVVPLAVLLVEAFLRA